jgi:hypothetical protein
VYVSFILIDGDNIQIDQELIYQLWKDPARGTVPVGTALTPVFQEFNSPLLDYYYANKTANDELIAGPCGFQFIYLDNFKDTLLPQWCALNLRGRSQITDIRTAACGNLDWKMHESLHGNCGCRITTVICETRHDKILVVRRHAWLIEFNRPANQQLPLRNSERGELIKNLCQAHGQTLATNLLEVSRNLRSFVGS